MTRDQGGTVAHPLDPLGADEIRQVATALRENRGVGPSWRFASIDLAEPAKDALKAGAADIGRVAHVICWDTADGRAYRALVSLPDGAITHWEHLPGIQPNMTVDEWHECDEMLRRHPALIDALARRGLDDMSLALTDVWAYGAALVPPRYQGLRLGWADVWARGSADGNPYAHHITGLHPIVDLNRMHLLELEDSDPAAGAGRPAVMGEYLPQLIPMPLREVSPLQVHQPEGVSFTLDGRLLRCMQSASGTRAACGPLRTGCRSRR
jgi:primary-amine oxidase